MCNTFRQQSAAADKWSWIHRGEPANINPPMWDPSWEARGDADETARSIEVTFGLQPHWAEFPLVNARAETVDVKKTFSASFRTHRVVIPRVSVWQERDTASGTRATKIITATGERTAFAGLAVAPEGGAPSNGDFHGWRFVVLTRNAPEPLAKVHRRAPVRLNGAETEGWLTGTPEDAKKILEASIALDNAEDVTIADGRY